MEFSSQNDWKSLIDAHQQTDNYQQLTDFVNQQYAHQQVYPAKNHIYRALSLTPFSEVKVVILGQDPYHQPGQAHGLAFSVPHGVTPPPSLKNIYKEINDDIGTQKDMNNGDLSSWAQQGVLLLNTVLTVTDSQPASHRDKGWEIITDSIIKKVSDEKEHCVFILWGSHAQQKQSLIDSSKHLIITSPHPSPLSAYRGFFGSKPFSRTNEYLKKHGKEIIRW